MKGIDNKTYRICKCCGGTGTQINKDGIRIKCPCCNGTGQWEKPKVHYYEEWKK